MYLLYNILLILLVTIAFPFWLYKVITKEKHRKGFWEKLGFGTELNSAPGDSRVRIHIHAVSVGEVIAAAPFIKGLRQRHPEIRLTLSTVTPSGNEVSRKRLPEVDRILYSPFDLPWPVKRFIRRVKPDIYVSVETELWPNFLREVKRSGARSLIINGRISPDAFKGYRRFRFVMKRVLSNVDRFCMQSDEDEAIISAYLESHKDSEKLRLIIVPRHIERTADIEKLVKAKGLDVIRRTGLRNSEKNDVPHRTVIVVDTIGELSTLYSIATVVIIGGSFIPHGGQNPLEAMHYRKPLIFGKHMFNFKQITEEILENGAGLMIEDNDSLKVALQGLLNNSSKQQEMGEKGYHIITKNRGAVERNIAIIEKFISGC